MTFLFRASKMPVLAGGLAVLALVGADSRDAAACGCFTPPDPSVPVVQAGERILFAMENGTVTAHIQIQYAGNAQEFGWLLPLPSIPTLELGTDELFNSLTTTTQPKYRLTTRYEGPCGFIPPVPPFAGPSGAATGNSEDSRGGGGPLVIQASIGPYDYAVLKADSKDEMLKWLADNRYFVPAGTDETVGQYIHPGAFFLALKLRSGQSAGDLQPVVVRYPSDLPMIPIVLTSVAAQPNMGIQVWMLGAGRAIPRNYYHTVINDMAIDWSTSGQNYNDVIIKAVGEAPGKHSFVTEYAGTSGVMANQLNYVGRFGSMAELVASPNAGAFLQYLQSHGYPFSSQMIAILSRYIPYPPALAQQGINEATFYANFTYYTGGFRTQFPSAFVGWAPGAYQPAAMAMEIQERVVKPTLEAAALFDKYPVLTRLYTTLSPEDMNKDPVFSFNRTLPDVSNVHGATLTYYCTRGDQGRESTPARLVTEQGWARDFPNGLGTGPVPALPPTGLTSRRIEMLREEGPSEIMTDNAPSGGCGCAIGGAGAGSARSVSLVGGAVALAAAGAVLGLRRRRRNRGGAPRS